MLAGGGVMKLIVGLGGLLFSSLVCAEHYGAALTSRQAVTVDSAIKQLASQPTARVVVQSKVGKVCMAKGCWLGLTDTGGEVRVTFKDYGFFVPPSLMGKTVLVEGVLEKTTLSLAETRHYVQDAGGDPSKVTQPRVEYRIVASGVEVLGS
jgi:hypothetical protein